jgi:hypothetical protein
MRGFFLTFPKVAALRRELSWTHFRTLLAVDDERARQWYMNEALPHKPGKFSLTRFAACREDKDETHPR